jgi:hypothetical protein
MDYFLNNVMDALEKFLEASDKDTMDAFQADQETRDHSQEYYESMQKLRGLLKDYNEFLKRR